MLGSRATDKGTCTRISCMRVMFWLSRAYAPLWWDSNYASNDPLLRHPALPAVFTCQSHEYRERKKAYCRAFELSTQSKETTSALLRPFWSTLRPGVNLGSPLPRTRPQGPQRKGPGRLLKKPMIHKYSGAIPPTQLVRLSGLRCRRPVGFFSTLLGRLAAFVFQQPATAA